MQKPPHATDSGWINILIINMFWVDRVQRNYIAFDFHGCNAPGCFAGLMTAIFLQPL
jgi:hypothetical protein